MTGGRAAAAADGPSCARWPRARRVALGDEALAALAACVRTLAQQGCRCPTAAGASWSG
jgi:hypothetical protein